MRSVQAGTPIRCSQGRVRSAVVLLLVLFTLSVCLFGCFTSPPAPPAPAVVPPAPPKPAKAQAPRTPPPAPVVQLPPVILLSDASQSYRELAELLKKRLDAGTTVFVMRAGSSLDEQLPAGNAPLLAVGLEAAIAALPQLRHRDVIFTLVFNHGDHRLLQQGMIGVSMLPPPQQVLSTIKTLNPTTKNIVLPCGPNLDEYVGRARREAKQLGLTLTTDAVGNDKELLLVAKRLGQSGEVLWLLPDNRIVSRESLQQVMASCIKAGRPTLVFSPSLFKLGGLLSAEYDLNSMAETIVAVMKKNPAERGKMKGSMLSPLRGTLAVNSNMAATLGLTVPTQLKPLLRDP